MEFIDKFNKSKNIQTYVNQCMNTSGPINDPNDPRVDARKRLVTDFRKDMSSYNKILLQSKTNVGANYQEHEKISAQPSPEIHAPNNIKFRATKSFICCFLTCSPLAIASCCFCQTPLVSTCSALVLASGATACVDCVSNHIAHD